MDELQAVLTALSALRAPRVQDEYDLHAQVGAALETAALSFRHEIKRGRPRTAALMRQLSGYAESPLVSAVVVVSERLPALPETVCGKPLRAIGLQRLWGVAL